MSLLDMLDGGNQKSNQNAENSQEESKQAQAPVDTMAALTDVFGGGSSAAPDNSQIGDVFQQQNAINEPNPLKDELGLNMGQDELYAQSEP